MYSSLCLYTVRRVGAITKTEKKEKMRIRSGSPIKVKFRSRTAPDSRNLQIFTPNPLSGHI